jgi:hypothetical protein
MNDPFITGFLKTLWILKDYLPVIVVGGGGHRSFITAIS